MRETRTQQIQFIAAHVPPSQRRKVRSGPRPANRATTEATVWALDPWRLHIACAQRSRVPKLSLHHPPGARSSRPVPHSPPSRRVRAIQLAVTPLADRAELRLCLRRGERCASQQHGPRRAPTGAVAAPARAFARWFAKKHASLLGGAQN